MGNIDFPDAFYFFTFLEDQAGGVRAVCETRNVVWNWNGNTAAASYCVRCTECVSGVCLDSKCRESHVDLPRDVISSISSLMAVAKAWLSRIHAEINLEFDILGSSVAEYDRIPTLPSTPTDEFESSSDIVCSAKDVGCLTRGRRISTLIPK